MSFPLALVFPRYCPFKFELWQALYHQAPLFARAQSQQLAPSLSLSFVLNAMLLWRVVDESPAVPEYEPT